VIERHESIVVTTFVRALVPPVQLFGLYVLVHGHESPGGGFQAGVILAAAYVLLALALGREAFDRRVSEPVCVALASAGVLLYALTGLAPLLAGAPFLDYAALPVPLGAVRARWLGILLIESGVALAVAATLVLIFCRLAAREDVSRW
jgi:multicomponent Na+:H+ antiporter subunit B